MSTPLLSEPAVTAAATILGAIVGSVATYTSQRAQWKWQYNSRWDEAKKNAYASLFSICNQWWRAIHWDFDKVADFRNRYIEVTGEVSILAEEPTRTAAIALMNYLGDLTDKFRESRRQAAASDEDDRTSLDEVIHVRVTAPRRPPGYDEDAERARFLTHRDAYRDAVRKELFGSRRR